MPRQIFDLQQETHRLAADVEHRLRVEAVERVTDVLHEYVRDGRCDLLVRVAGLTADEFAEVEADEVRHPHGLPMKREWLTGPDSMLIVEYVADPDSESRRERLDQPLRHDYDTLRSTRRSGGQIAFETAVRVRKELCSDTLAPTWLREYADETVELLREEASS